MVKKSSNKSRIGVLTANFSDIKNYSAQHTLKQITVWRAGDVIRDEEELDELITLNAPIEVYVSDGLHRTAKS